MSRRAWRLFILLNGIGTFLFTFGTIDGSPITAAFLPIGSVLLLPGSFVTFLIGPHLSRLLVNDTLASFVAAWGGILVNLTVWLGLNWWTRQPEYFWPKRPLE